MNFLKIPSLLLIFILCPSLWSQNESSEAVSSGAVIVISITDPVRFIDANGRPMNEKVRLVPSFRGADTPNPERVGDWLFCCQTERLLRLSPEQE